MVASNENVAMIIFESLPELITHKSLASVREAVGNKRLQIGVGFESVNDDIRCFCANKRNTLADYINAFAVMREFEVEALAYCLMKPVFLDEQTAIDDCVRSVKFAFEHGVKAVSIEPVSVQDNTTVAFLNAGKPLPIAVDLVVVRSYSSNSLSGRCSGGRFRIIPTSSRIRPQLSKL